MKIKATVTLTFEYESTSEFSDQDDLDLKLSAEAERIVDTVENFQIPKFEITDCGYETKSEVIED